nr:hypothetical protein [Deltaproteobacteria bacterium]
MPHRDERPRGATTVTLDDLDLAVSPARSAVVSPPCMGECVDDRHPTLQGRVRVRWTDATGGPRDRWVPTLQGVAVREGDRVLLVAMAHEDEPVVTGVIDGFAARPAAEERGPVLSLAQGESLRVLGSDGAPLVELRQSPDGPGGAAAVDGRFDRTAWEAEAQRRCDRPAREARRGGGHGDG